MKAESGPTAPLFEAVSSCDTGPPVTATVRKHEQEYGSCQCQTAWSISICVLTILFALTSLAALIQAWRARHWAIRRGVWMHSLLVAAACTAIAIYSGVIGLRTWG